MKGHREASVAMEHLSSIAEKGIKVRKNSSADWYYGSKHRRRQVRDYRYKGYKRWSSENSYGI